jgi:hypothetical protein
LDLSQSYVSRLCSVKVLDTNDVYSRAYCETTTIHGFVYWVNAPRLIEKLFWVVVVLTGFVCACLIINDAFDEWQKNPGVVTINSFSKVNIVMTLNMDQ